MGIMTGSGECDSDDCTKAEWKECAERRLAENLALHVIIEEMDWALQGMRGQERIVEFRKLIDTAREVGR
jgi:hypothetical protein